jgi:hypothetical protein
MDAGTTTFQPDLDVLSDRILKARILREHHLWDAAKALSLCRHGQEPDRSDRRFAALMEADALVDATLLLAAQARPPRSLAGIRPDQTAWVCTMRCECGGGGAVLKPGTPISQPRCSARCCNPIETTGTARSPITDEP